MAPGILSDELPVREASSTKNKTCYPEPLELTGALEHFSREDVTPVTSIKPKKLSPALLTPTFQVIGTEFPNVNIVEDLLNAPNADELLRDLAITSTAPFPSPIHPF